MKQKKRNLCKKIFTRRWNLERHLQDVHKIYDNTKKDNINPEFIDYGDLPNNINRNSNRNKNNDNNISEMINNENSYYNNFSNTFPYLVYYNGEFYTYSNFNPSPFEKEKRLSLEDKIKIQKVLTDLESHLIKIGCPMEFVFRLKRWLKYRCSCAKTDEPLKKYLVNNNFGNLWPS